MFIVLCLIELNDCHVFVHATILLQIYVDIVKIDCSLTSCIAISFLFNALVDARLIPERAFGTM